MNTDPKPAVTENDIDTVREAFRALRNSYRTGPKLDRVVELVSTVQETEKRILAHLNSKDPNATT